jgi:hypothetical protein
MKTVILKRFPPKGYAAITLWPWLIIRKEHAPISAGVRRHQEIHAVQQKETGIVLFYLWYAVEYLIRRWNYKSHYKGYRSISFEAEAYANDHKPEYLLTRKRWTFLKYI